MSLSPVLRNNAAYIRYRYAQNHLERLRVQLKLEEKLDNFIFDSVSDDSSKENIRFKKHPDVLLSLILGDFIHSLRSSLDYVACALVTLNNPDADLKRVQFPFGRKGVRLNCNEKGSDKGISEEALEAIERARVQYGEGLSLLCEFSNQDKHRFLMPAYPHLKRFEFVFDQNEGKSELQPVDEDMLLIRDGSRVDFPNGSVIQPRIGFQLERDDVSYGSEHIDGMNEAVRCTLNALIPLTQSSQGVHP